MTAVLPGKVVTGHELQQVILENTTGKPDLTLCITTTVTTGFISFEYKLGLNYKVTVNLAICAPAGPGMFVRHCLDN